jgi:hypothetical protein
VITFHVRKQVGWNRAINQPTHAKLGILIRGSGTKAEISLISNISIRKSYDSFAVT